MDLLSPDSVEKYLQRINCNGSKELSVENLSELCRCHVTTVPEDTLDMFGGPGKVADLKKIYENIVCNGRGGFCYEQNGLFGRLLESLGYEVVLLEGSYFMEEKDEFSFKFNHMLLKVQIDGKEWVIDVGFGYPSFYYPLKLEPMLVQEQQTGLFRIREAIGESGEYYVEKHRKEIVKKQTGDTKQPNKKDHQLSKYEKDANWKIMFRFSDAPRIFNDFLPGWRKHTDDKDSFFRANSFLQIFTESGSRLLWGTTLIETEFCGPLREKVKYTELMPGQDQEKEWMNIRNIIKDIFGVTLDFKPSFAARDYHT